MRHATAFAVLALFALPGCFSYDTCEGTICGNECWICSPLEGDCGSREPDGVCDGDGSCKETGVPSCR